MTNRRWRTLLAGSSGLIVALASSCVGDLGDVDGPPGQPYAPPPAPGPNPSTWSPAAPVGECNVDALLLPHSYGGKVKTLLTGLPLDDAELAAIQSDPDTLAERIDGWLDTPEADALLTRFFMTAFQQTGGNNESFFYLQGKTNVQLGRFNNPNSPRIDEMFNANFSESFARTALELVKQGRPFSDVITTDSFMMTTAMMSFLAFSDDEVVDDNEGHTVRTTAGHFDEITLVRDQQDAPPVSEALDPTSPNFATFWHPRLAQQLDQQLCDVQPSQTIDTTQLVNGEWKIRGGHTPSYFVFSAVALGRMQQIGRHQSNLCNTNASNIEPLLQRDDFSDWRMVKVRKPSDSGEEPSHFYRDAELRASSELVLHTPRAGFLTAPGFFSTWPTNEDNSSRVTINQALIVALGASFEGVAISNFEPEGLDEEHANPQSECYGCHQPLDPMRDYFRASFSNFYGQQLDPERTELDGFFFFGGAEESGSGIDDLMLTLASHDLFPQAWAQKLCYYANAEACPEGEELDRVVAEFIDSNLDFKVLVRELFSSPLITGSACVDGVDAGTTAIIARRSNFCHQLSHRLGFDDLCGLRTAPEDASNLQNDVRDAMASVPDDGFSRAEIAPVVIAETGMFARANREAACSIAAQQGYDLALGEMTADDAIDAMVEGIMGLPPTDPRHDAAKAILNEHYDEVIADGVVPNRTALQSVLVLACMSPGSAGVGF